MCERMQLNSINKWVEHRIKFLIPQFPINGQQSAMNNEFWMNEWFGTKDREIETG